MKIKLTQDQSIWKEVEIEVQDFDEETKFLVGYDAVKKLHPELTPENHSAKIEINREVDGQFINVVEIFDSDANPLLTYEYEHD